MKLGNPVRTTSKRIAMETREAQHFCRGDRACQVSRILVLGSQASHWADPGSILVQSTWARQCSKPRVHLLDFTML